MTVIPVRKICQLLISELRDATAHGTDLQLAMRRPWSHRALAMVLPEVPVGAVTSDMIVPGTVTLGVVSST